jgi:O-antigen ligase
MSIDQRTSIFGYYSRFNGGLLSTICYLILYWAFVSNMNKIKTRKTIYFLLASALLVSIYGILEHFGKSISCLFVTGNFDNNCWVQDVQARVFATLGQPNWLAALLTAVMPLTWHKTTTEKIQNKKILWLVLSLLFFLCILFTKSRSGLLALLVAYLIFWVFNFKKYFKLFIFTNIVLIIALAFFGSPFTPSINELINHQSKTQNTSTDKGEGGTESGQIRQIVWKGAIDIAKNYPIFGTGVETFGFSYWQFRPIEHNKTTEWDFLYNKAHNEYLNFLANTGVIGLLTYLTLLIFSLYVLRKNPALLAGYVSILITNFFGFSVVTISLLTFLLPAFAISLNSSSKEKAISTKNSSNNQKLLLLIVLISSLYLLFCIGKYWYADYLYQTGTRNSQTKIYKDAISSLQSAINYSPEEPIYHNQLAKTLTEITLSLATTNEATEAGKIIPYITDESSTALNLSPRNLNIRQSRINIYLQLANLDARFLEEIIPFIKETINLSPTDPKLLVFLGKAYANMGEFNLSEEAFKKALLLKPDYKEAQKDIEIVKKLQDEKK